MAKRIDSAEFDRPRQGSRFYPWDEWMDGSAWEIEQGVDFYTGVEQFRAQMYVMAKRRGGKVTTTSRGKTIRFQFRANG